MTPRPLDELLDYNPSKDTQGMKSTLNACSDKEWIDQYLRILNL